MKTLILNGSPRKNGDTAAMIAHLQAQLRGETKIIRAYDGKIAPCTDCRACKIKKGCVISDGMQAVYAYLEECDHVVIASPIYFSELSGALLSVASRLQTYFSARFFRKEEPALSRKKGAVLLAGGGTGDPVRAYTTASELLHYMNVQEIYPLICSHNTDRIPACKDEAVLKQIGRAAAFFNDAGEAASDL
ncbi:MAG: flavodoxin family protein [Ruminococcus sp.]|nr:flavodoxin family protein [Ruminococcus sp.]